MRVWTILQEVPMVDIQVQDCLQEHKALPLPLPPLSMDPPQNHRHKTNKLDRRKKRGREAHPALLSALLGCDSIVILLSTTIINLFVVFGTLYPT